MQLALLQESHTLITVLSAGVLLGVLHAFDADHVLALSSVREPRGKINPLLNYCHQWALGHAVSLMGIGLCVYCLGMAVPTQFSAYTEVLVGVVMIALGLLVIRDSLPKHSHRQTTGRGCRAGPKAVSIGVLHGMAGSAPLLALWPLSQLAAPWYGMAYLLVFSSGVFLSMSVLGGVLNGIYPHFERWSLATAFRIALGVAALAWGAHVLGGLS